MNATELISACAMIIGFTRCQRRNRTPKITPRITLTMNGPWFLQFHQHLVGALKLGTLPGVNHRHSPPAVRRKRQDLDRGLWIFTLPHPAGATTRLGEA